MAIDSYTALKTALADHSNRSDLTSYLDDFIDLAEARLNDMLLLKNYESEESISLTVGQNYVAIPTGYISPIALWLIVDTIRVELPRVLPEDLPYYPSNSRPRFYAIDGANIRFDYPSDSTYSGKFRMYKTSALSGTNTTNYLLTRRPDIYLAACLVELARFTDDDSLFNRWEPRFIKATSELKSAENRARKTTMRTDFPISRGRSNILTDDTR